MAELPAWRVEIKEDVSCCRLPLVGEGLKRRGKKGVRESDVRGRSHPGSTHIYGHVDCALRVIVLGDLQHRSLMLIHGSLLILTSL